MTHQRSPCGLIYKIIDQRNNKIYIGQTTKFKNFYSERYYCGSKYVKNARKCISQEDTHLHSLIDDIVCLIYKTVYKLKFLK